MHRSPNGLLPRPCRTVAHSALLALVIALAATAVPRAATAQDAAVFRGLDLEAKGKFREAAVAFREAMAGNADPQHATQAMLGLERAYAELGWSDSLVPLLDSALRTRPRDAT